MTLTSERPRRSGPVSASPTSATPALVAPTAPPRPVLRALAILDDTYRVMTDDGTVVGYVQVVGAVFVGLHGPVYNTSVEVGQHLDLDTALDNLATYCRESR